MDIHVARTGVIGLMHISGYSISAVILLAAAAHYIASFAATFELRRQWRTEELKTVESHSDDASGWAGVCAH